MLDLYFRIGAKYSSLQVAILCVLKYRTIVCKHVKTGVSDGMPP